MIFTTEVPIRRAQPRLPSLGLTLLAAVLITAGIATAPQVIASTPAAVRGSWSDLGTPVAELIHLQTPAWQDTARDYAPLPRRSSRMNDLLGRTVELLTRGTAVESRQRLLSLQASLEQSLNELQRLSSEAALTPVDPCNLDGRDLMGTMETLTCRFAPSRSDRLEAIRDVQGTVQQRAEQIAAERERFATDLKAINLAVTPGQVDGLLRLATAGDIVSLHAAYANLSTLSTRLRTAMLSADHSSATAQRYYGIYVVLLEVGLHLHEEFYLKLRSRYLPRLESVARDSAATYRQARRLAALTDRPELKKQLEGNMAALQTTLHAAKLYHSALLAQAKAVNASWQRLYEQHQVAVNSYRAVNLSGSLLDQMSESGRTFSNLRQLDVPALEGIGNAALQREFERLTSQLVQPES